MQEVLDNTKCLAC